MASRRHRYSGEYGEVLDAVLTAIGAAIFAYAIVSTAADVIGWLMA